MRLSPFHGNRSNLALTALFTFLGLGSPAHLQAEDNRKAPSVPGTYVGQVAKMPYTADYFFYRATH